MKKNYTATYTTDIEGNVSFITRAFQEHFIECPYLDHTCYVLPSLDMDVLMTKVEYKKYDYTSVREVLKNMPAQLLKKQSGWHFSLSAQGYTNSQQSIIVQMFWMIKHFICLL